MTQWLLACGVNDLGGTLMNESISTAAGAEHGQLARPRTLRRLAREAGRVPAERSTTYAIRRRFDGEVRAEDALDAVDDHAAPFGSHERLIAEGRHPYEHRIRRAR